MSKSIFMWSLLLYLPIAGCSSTRIFLGSYDSVKFAVSPNQARMLVKNFTYETRLCNGRPEKKLVENSVSLSDDSDMSSVSETIGDTLHVNIVCPDENLTEEISDSFHKNGFIIGKRFRKPKENCKTISKVTIYPKRRDRNYAEDGYRLVTFETMGGLSGGTHRVLVKEPLVLVLCPPNITANTKQINVSITHSGFMYDRKFVIGDSVPIIPITENIQTLSKIISTTQKPIKIIFTVSREFAKNRVADM